MNEEADHFTADLSAQLRNRGVEFDPAALKAFASQVRRERSDDADAETPLDRFIAARQDYAVAVRKAYYASHRLGFGILLMLLGLCASGPMFLDVLAIGHAVDPIMIVVCGVLLLIGCVVGTIGIIRSATSGLTLLRARKEVEEAFARRRPITPSGDRGPT